MNEPTATTLAKWRKAYNHAVHKNRSYKRIALLMGISPSTVSRYVDNYATHLRIERRREGTGHGTG